MIVIKYGGHALPKAGSTDPVLTAIAKRHMAGEKIVVVHGGGPQINAALAEKGIGKEMVGGYRKTTPEVFEIVQRVLSGSVLPSIVNQLLAEGVNAVGLSSSGAGLIRAGVMNDEIGLVGEVKEVNPKILHTLIKDGFLPVISPIGASAQGVGLNLNADLVAGAIGGALLADHVLYMTDVSGIFRNWPDESSLIESITVAELESLLPTFSDGMIPKVTSALAAIAAGAKMVRIFDGRAVANLESALSGKGGTVVLP